MPRVSWYVYNILLGVMPHVSCYASKILLGVMPLGMSLKYYWV